MKICCILWVNIVKIKKINFIMNLKDKKIALVLLAIGFALIAFYYFDSIKQKSDIDPVLGIDLSWLETYEKDNVELLLRENPKTHDLEIVKEELSERERFIEATYDATCLIFSRGTVYDEDLDTEVKQIYIDYGFDATKKNVIDDLTTKYVNATDFQARIADAIAECKID